WLTSKDNPYFAPAAVNRLWAHFFARGLVNPLDDMHAQNKPSHPTLLEALAEEFRRCGHDVRHLIRAICFSSAYQRTSRPLGGNAEDDGLFSDAPVKVMGAQALVDSLMVATGRPVGLPPRFQQRLFGMRKMMAKRPGGLGGDPRVRFLDTREYDDDP